MVSRTFCAHLILWLASSSLARVQNFTITSQDWKSRLTANFSFDANVPCTYSDCVVEPYTSKALTHNWRRGISTVVTDRSVDLEFYGMLNVTCMFLETENTQAKQFMCSLLFQKQTKGLTLA